MVRLFAHTRVSHRLEVNEPPGLDAKRIAKAVEAAGQPDEPVAAMGVFSPPESVTLQYDRRVAVR